jgi:CRISPR-associated protein Csm4
MKTYIYRLLFTGPTHFGLAGIDLEAVEDHLSSDSLTSAIVNATAILEGPEGASKVVSALSSESPSFRLSSLFPYGPDPVEKEKIVEAVVKPMINPPVEKAEVLREWNKDLKRIRYLRPEDFSLWIGNRPLGEKEIEGLVKRSKDLTENWWKEDLRPRVALDRQSQNSSLWSQAGIWFAKEQIDSKGVLSSAKSGLYGLVQFFDETWKDSLAQAFKMLGDTGLGGERTYGMGLFEFGGFENLPQRWQNIIQGKSDRHVFMSLYYPAESEREGLKDSLEAWDSIERRGFIVSARNATSFKRKRIRMLAEGSVARTVLRGSIADVTPTNFESLGLTHKVYRSGLAFLIP